MKRRLDIIVLVVCSALFVALAYGRFTLDRERRPSVYSTYDTGPNGYRALYEVLGVAGVPLQRFERVLPSLVPSIRTLVLTGYEDDPSAKPLDRRDAEFLSAFVKKGGRLVAIDAEFAGPVDVTPGVGTTLLTPGGGDTIPLARDAYTQGVERLRGPVNWIFSFKERHGIPLLANAQGIVAFRYRIGRGDVIAISAPALFGNQRLNDGDNLRFAYNVIAGHGDVAFDEYVHGYSEDASLWAVLPRSAQAALWITLAIVILALIGANVPFAPPYLPVVSGERTTEDYITAVAQLMRRSRHRPPDDDVLWHAQTDFQRRKGHA
ncbi:MAG: DUF4350 domain-containing protein [Candidatus Eremiobacteraeota bacterium]|nr:DUF4350 domain-containing protein [Candidatus Eremiobacteraeota bacterium]